MAHKPRRVKNLENANTGRPRSPRVSDSFGHSVRRKPGRISKLLHIPVQNHNHYTQLRSVRL